MAGWSAGVFWVPILTAIAGARIAEGGRLGQAAGGIAGLLFGAALARGVYLAARGVRSDRGRDT